jgi:hypothetical protein
VGRDRDRGRDEHGHEHDENRDRATTITNTDTNTTKAVTVLVGKKNRDREWSEPNRDRDAWLLGPFLAQWSDLGVNILLAATRTVGLGDVQDVYASRRGRDERLDPHEHASGGKGQPLVEAKLTIFSYGGNGNVGCSHDNPSLGMGDADASPYVSGA